MRQTIMAESGSWAFPLQIIPRPATKRRWSFEHGPVTGREARVYPDDGHCAFKYFTEWAPESFRWLRGKLG